MLSHTIVVPETGLIPQTKPRVCLHGYEYPGYEAYPGFDHMQDILFTWNKEKCGYSLLVSMILITAFCLCCTTKLTVMAIEKGDCWLSAAPVLLVSGVSLNQTLVQPPPLPSSVTECLTDSSVSPAGETFRDFRTEPWPGCTLLLSLTVWRCIHITDDEQRHENVSLTDKTLHSCSCCSNLVWGSCCASEQDCTATGRRREYYSFHNLR